jgi:NTE family protein
VIDSNREARPRGFEIVLVLSGGNVLGAFEAGVYQAMHENDLLRDWIVGASIGAINRALIAGSAPERRIDMLRKFWRPSAAELLSQATPWWASQLETMRRTVAVGWTTMAGRSGIFWSDSLGGAAGARRRAFELRHRRSSRPVGIPLGAGVIAL